MSLTSRSNRRWQVTTVFMRKDARNVAYMLGLRQLGVVAHGRFSARGFARAIEVAARGVQQDVIGRTRAALLQAGALRPPSGRPGPVTARAAASSEATATVTAP